MSSEENSGNEDLLWNKAAQGLRYLQEGLEDFVEEKVKRHHKKLLKRSGVTALNTCSDCTIENILPEHPDGKCSQENSSKCLCKINRRNRRLCPAGICSKMYDYIVYDHCFKSPLWSNTDSSKWCSESWSIANAYQTTVTQNNSAHETDASGLLSVIINDTTFADQLSNPVERYTDQTNNIYCKARKARNDILHSPKMKIDRVKLFEYLDLFCEVLKDIKDLLHRDKAKKAFDAIQELKRADIKISSEDKKKIKIQLENALQEIEREKQNALSEIKKTVPIRIEDDYEKRKSDLQIDLLYLNRQQHNSIPISPLFEWQAKDLSEIYVFPKLKYVDVHGRKSDIIYQREKKNIVSTLNADVHGRQSDIKYKREKKNIVSTLHDIFHSQGNSAINEIYLLADAGLGKTAFCKFLAVCWWHAQDPKQKESAFFDHRKDDLETMRKFKFLFFISLRNAREKEVHIDDMIQTQICSVLARGDFYSRSFIQRILTEEKSLIIVDGLDEWQSPQPEEKLIPDRCLRPNCTILTTTRTWKFSMLQLGPNQIDKKVLLKGLDESSGKKLAENVISKVLTDTAYKNFRQEIEERSLDDLARNPLIHMFLICLWTDQQSLGNTRCQIYSNLLNIFIARSKNRKVLGSHIISSENNELLKDQLTHFYRENEYCRKYKHYIKSLADLAAGTLLSKSKHSSLVFDEQVTSRHLSDDCLSFSLAIGVLTKLEVPVKPLTKSPQKFSFLHKTIQEFFTALNLCLTQEFPRVCDSLDSILDLSNVFIFVSGLSKETISKVLLHIKNIVSNDPVVTNYRKEALSSSFVRHNRKLMLKHQEMQISCMKEIHSSEQKCSTIEDFIIMENNSNNSSFQTLLSSSIEKQTVRSMTIDNQKSMGTLSEIIEKFKLGQIKSLERLDYWGTSTDGDFSEIMSSSENSLKCMTLHSNTSNEEGIHTLLSARTLFHMKNLQNLESLSLWYVTMCHAELDDLLFSISQRSNMSYIGLQDVKCKDEKCTGFAFNLSKHEKLEILNIGHIPLKDIKINTTSLRECRLVEFPFIGVLNSILDCLPAASKLEIFTCHFLTNVGEICAVMDMLPSLQTLKMIRFYGLEFVTQASILPSSLQNMELLQLVGMTLSCTSLKETIEVIQSFPQVVDIELRKCSIYPDDAFRQLLKDIKQSKDLQFLTYNMDAREFDIKKIQSQC